MSESVFRIGGVAADAAVALAAGPFALAGVYLAALSIPPKRRIPPINTTLRVAVVVPAHNEATDIAATVQSILGSDYPSARRRVLVVADNCSDDTASIARVAGAEVLERFDDERRGKGYALELVFNHLLDAGSTDVIVVVDADTVVSSNLLTACASRIADGERVVQVDYQVRNAERSWRTRLLHIAFTAFHDVRSAGRERFRLSCGLRGNGMAFSVDTLRLVPHSAFSIVEDLEYGIALGRAGVRVAYAHEAWVQGHMPSDAKSSESQRSRWEGGRALIRRRDGKSLVTSSIKQRSRVLADLAADVYVPPLAQLSTSLIGLSAIAVGGSAVSSHVGGRSWRSPLVGAIGLAGLGFHVAEGWRRSGTGAAGLLDLARAPIYVGWKLAGKVTKRQSPTPTEWVRTQRDRQEGAA